MDPVEQLMRRRDEALLSLDRTKILAFAAEMGVPMPPDDDSFWVGVHQARTATASLPIEERRKSKRWLIERGLPSLDDGEL